MKTKTFSLGLVAVALSSMLATPVMAETLQEAVKKTLATNPDIRVETNERLSREKNGGQQASHSP